MLKIKRVTGFYNSCTKKISYLQVSFDIFNFTKLINKNWGVRKFAPNFGNIELLKTESNGTAPVYSFDPEVVDNLFQIDDSGIESSRWQMQIGLRYIFE